MARVAIELVNGGQYQAACRTENCTETDGQQWRGSAWLWLPAARTEAYAHKDWHQFTEQGGQE